MGRLNLLRRPLASFVFASTCHTSPALAGARGEAPSCKFHKRLIARSGTQVHSFPTRIAPDSAQLVGAIEWLLAEP